MIASPVTFLRRRLKALSQSGAWPRFMVGRRGRGGGVGNVAARVSLFVEVVDLIPLRQSSHDEDGLPAALKRSSCSRRSGFRLRCGTVAVVEDPRARCRCGGEVVGVAGEFLRVLDVDLEAGAATVHVCIRRYVLDELNHVGFGGGVVMPPVPVGVHEIEVDAVVACGDDAVQVVVEDALPLGLPVADLVVAGPVGVRRAEPRWRAGIGLPVPVGVPALLPVPA